MTPDQPTSVRILVTDEQVAELRRILAGEPGALTIHPADDIKPLRTALAFYADPANWREGCGTGPQRAAPCVADDGRRAQEALGHVDTGTGYARLALSSDGEIGPERHLVADGGSMRLSGRIWRFRDE